jgi:hypothetical protein
MHLLRTTLLLTLALPAGAQSKATTEDSDPIPAANPARPTVTNPAHIPPPGYLQFEQGFLQGNDSQGVNAQTSIVQTTKLALNHYVMIQAGDQPYAYTRQPPTTNDTGDLTLGAQVLFNDEEEGRASHPTVALGYNRRVRSGTAPNLDIGGFSQGLLLLASGTNYGIHYDSNLLFNEQDASGTGGRSAHRAQYGQSISLTRQINQPWSITGELWHFTQPTVFTTREGAPVPRANAVGLLFAGGYSPRPNLVFDFGFEHGLTSTSTNWQGFAGLTYLLPHRLWQGGRR